MMGWLICSMQIEQNNRVTSENATLSYVSLHSSHYDARSNYIETYQLAKKYKSLLL